MAWWDDLQDLVDQALEGVRDAAEAVTDSLPQLSDLDDVLGLPPGEPWIEEIRDTDGVLDQDVIHIEGEPTAEELYDWLDAEDWDNLLLYIEGDFDEDTEDVR